jgi:hypothetical protein
MAQPSTAEWVTKHLHVTLSPWQRRLLDQLDRKGRL